VSAAALSLASAGGGRSAYGALALRTLLQSARMSVGLLPSSYAVESTAMSHTPATRDGPTPAHGNDFVCPPARAGVCQPSAVEERTETRIKNLSAVSFGL